MFEENSEIIGWLGAYETSRYLRNLDDSLLKNRQAQLEGNLWSTDREGKVQPPRDYGLRRRVLELLVHVLDEMRLRNGEKEIKLSEADIRAAASARYAPPALDRPFGLTPGAFAKFGRKIHIRKTFEEGLIRIAPASNFNDPSLNPAQRDDELMHWSRTPNRHLLGEIRGFTADGTAFSTPFSEMNGEFLQGMSVSDFYVWCCGYGADARLFHDFEADAVVIVRDGDEFKRRIAAAVSSLLPDCAMDARPMQYYDPYNIEADQLFPIFVKNIKYLYQNEYRFAWSVDRGAALAPLYPRLGSLEDISEYHEII